jgi:hypothetical protein
LKWYSGARVKSEKFLLHDQACPVHRMVGLEQALQKRGLLQTPKKRQGAVTFIVNVILLCFLIVFFT